MSCVLATRNVPGLLRVLASGNVSGISCVLATGNAPKMLSVLTAGNVSGMSCVLATGNVPEMSCVLVQEMCLKLCPILYQEMSRKFRSFLF